MQTLVPNSLILLTALVFVPAQSEGNSASLMAPRIADFKKSIHRMLEGSRIRKKRQLENFGDPSDYRLRFDSVSPADLPYLSDFNLTFWIPVSYRQTNQVLIGTSQGVLYLFQIPVQDGKIAATIAASDQEDLAVKAMAFSHNDEQWFSVLHMSNDGYYIRMYQRVGRGLERRQKITLLGPSDMELIMLKGIHYLAVATYQTRISNGISYQASIVLYHWIHTQFDEIASRVTYGARSLACWVLGGSIYFAVGQELNDEGNYQVGSPVFFYNSKEENKLVLREMLPTFGPMKVRHFYVGGSHYLIFIGGKDAVIYWWSNGQFLEWQTLPGTAFASDLSVLYLEDGEIAIVIGLKEEALFYTLDSSGHYIRTFTMSFKGSTLASLHFMNSGKSYYALALFSEAYNLQSFWRLTVGSQYLPSVSLLDPLQQCLLDTQELLKERQSELDTIKTDLNRVWLKGSNQKITSKVVVKGKIKSTKEVKAKDVIIIRYAKLPDASISLVIDGLVKAKDSTDSINSELKGAVFKSVRQEIRGTKNFNDLVYVPSLTMDSVDSDMTINGVLLSRLENSALKKVGNQLFSNSTSISNLQAESVNVNLLNGIPTDDLLLRHGKQVVTGDLTFLDVKGADLSTSTVNYIPVDDIVTTTSTKPIRDLKTIPLLQSDIIDVQGEINGVSLKDTAKNVALVDRYNEFHGSLSFEHPLTVQGDLFLTSRINKVFDLSKLVSHSVTRDTQQDLTGLYRFKANWAIGGDLLVAGTVNKVTLDNLLTLSSNQKIYADMVFAGPLTVNRNLLVDDVNGVDLSEQALKRSLPLQFLTGLKTFDKDVFVDFVDMTEYVTIDGVDPSLLVQDIVHHKQGVVNSNSTSFTNVVVLGNVTALGEINGHNVEDLNTLFWLKSEQQEIPTPLAAYKLHFKNDLYAVKVNEYNLDKDLIHTFLDESIFTTKEFHHKIVMSGLETSDDVTVNGINPQSFTAEFERCENEKTIHGTKTLQSLEVQGDMNIKYLNEVPISHIMLPYARQTVDGPLNFTSELTSIVGDMTANKMSFENINAMNITDYYGKAVLPSGLVQPVTNKNLKYLKASNLALPYGSRINGISLHDFAKRVVTLNSTQDITSSKSMQFVKFEKMISVSNLNDLELSRFLDNVVLTDEKLVITNKQFSKMAKAKNALVEGSINGIKIEDMAANVFYKSEYNAVTELFLFKKDVDIDDLVATSTLDGIDWSKLIFLKRNEVLGPTFLLSDTSIKGDLFVTGKLNGCDLSELASKAIYSDKPSQVIKEHINVQNVVIIGNVNYEDKMNKISVEQLENFITSTGDQYITSDVIINADWVVEKLHLNKHASSSQIGNIVNDAVRHSIPRVIEGRKVFKNGLHLKVLAGGDILAHRVEGVPFDELYRKTVRKYGQNELMGDKIFSTLNTSFATAKGYINGISLPRDVVLANTSEHISHATFFMSDVYMMTDLIVHGLLDRISLNPFLEKLVSLSKDQNITSQLIFFDEVMVKEPLTIDGAINEIVLELVAKVKSQQHFQGYKVFVELFISGPLSAESINGLDVQALVSKIVKHNKEDYVNAVQVFEKPIEAQSSLFVEWINNVPLRQLIDSYDFAMTSISTLISYLQDFSFSLQQHVIHQLSATQEQVSKFGHFILFQELNMGPTTKILNGYSLQHKTRDFFQSMVMWTTQKHCIYGEKCCHLEFSYWMRVKKDGFIMVDGTAESGRYYPLQSSDVVLPEKDYFMWTNATDTQPKWCDKKNHKMFLASYSHEGSLEVSINVEDAPLLRDIKTFKRGNLYAVAGYFYDTTQNEYSSTVVYVYDELTMHWSKHQILSSFGVLSLDVIDHVHHNYRDEILLAVGNGMPIIPSSYSTIYKWNNQDQKFDVLQNIPSRYVTSTLWIRKGKELLLSMANVDNWPARDIDCSETVSDGAINIYLYKEQQLHWVQSIPAKGIISMVSFTVHGDVFLAAASSQHETIYIYEWKGYAGFVEIQTMLVGDVKSLSVYSIEDDVYMAVAMNSSPSMILKMIRKGHHSNLNFSAYGHKMNPNDESSKETKLISGC